MAQKAKIEIQETDKNGNQVEVAKKVPVEKAKQYVKGSSAMGPRSVFAKGRGRRPAVSRNQSGPRSCFAVGSKGGPQDGTGPLGGTEACPNS